jgi:hypothetical protein
LWWHYGITVERQPVTIVTFQVPGLDLGRQPTAADERMPSAIGAFARQSDQRADVRGQ